MIEFNSLTEIVADKQVLLILLMFPIVATIVGIARHIIGLKTLGIYAPVVLTFSLYAMGITFSPDGTANGVDFLTGLKFGLVFTSVVILTTLITSNVLKPARMHYFPKIAIVISMVALSLFIAILLGEILGRQGFASTNVFAIILIASIAEQFSSILFKKQFKDSLFLLLETMILAVICFALISLPEFQEIILTYPYLVLLTLLINYFVGKYKGLRVREYVRFREILNMPEDEATK